MTGADAYMFKGLRQAGKLTMYRLTMCEGPHPKGEKDEAGHVKRCCAEVPKPKRFCSKVCYENAISEKEEGNGDRPEPGA